MKATLVIIENDTDHGQAKALIKKRMGSNDPADRFHISAHLLISPLRCRGLAA
jgi:hypothetical protein